MERSTGERGIAAGRALEAHLNRYDAQVNALDDSAHIAIRDNQGHQIGSMSGQEVKAVWNGTHFTITSHVFNNGGAGGGMRGAWSGTHFEGWARFNPSAVETYSDAAQARGFSREAGVSTLAFHEISHETHMGNRLQTQFRQGSSPSMPEERATSSIGRAMSGSVGAPFVCDVAGGCQ